MADTTGFDITDIPNRSRRALSKEHDFVVQPSRRYRARMKEIEALEGSLGKHLEPIFGGVSAIQEGHLIKIGFSSHDGTYAVDFTVRHLDVKHCEGNKVRISKIVADFIVTAIRSYELDHYYKFLGLGLTSHLEENISPELPSRIWSELDIVPVVFAPTDNHNGTLFPSSWVDQVDGQADSMARKVVMLFGPTQQPRLDIGWRNEVGVDADGQAILTSVEDYRLTCGEPTWNTALKYIDEIRHRKVRIAFFNSTPQGGGVALMRHALVRFLRLFDVDVHWYVPKPRPEVFRITKSNHNILQGVNGPGENFTDEHGRIITDWIEDNARRYWLGKGGPLSARSEGGADVIFVDDPQMPGLIRLAKNADAERQVVFRSHIQIRSDLVDQEGTLARKVWTYLWNDIEHADLFIAHPVKDFVPKDVPAEKVGYMPATTDWLDGLNKELNPWAWGYHVHNYNVEADSKRMVKLNWPTRRYIIQIARFDPSKGIDHLVKAYGILRRKHLQDKSVDETPQLVIVGHGAIDDPDGTRIYDETLKLLETEYEDIKDSVSVMRLGPIDQQLNALLSTAHIACQLSTREGFEIKVSEALHKGIPVIASTAGGIPLQVQHEKNGFLVDPENEDEVAARMFELFSNDALRSRMSDYAKNSVSDELSTVGNAVSWLYLANELSECTPLTPNGRWINDMAREEADEPYGENETRLPRHLTT